MDFKEVGGFRTQVEGGDEYLDSKAMAIEYKDLRQRAEAQGIYASRTESAT